LQCFKMKIVAHKRGFKSEEKKKGDSKRLL
jgi:hypothetical protein